MSTTPTHPVQSAQGFELVAWAAAELAELIALAGSNGDDEELA